MANMKNGIIAMIISSEATLVPTAPLVRKNRGTPASAPRLKQMIWRLVRLKTSLDLTRVKSLGTGT